MRSTRLRFFMRAGPRRFAALLGAAAVLAGVPPIGAQSPEATYDVKATEAWRAQRERDLRSETGWLTLAGLSFLEPGPNTVGSDPASDIVLPPGTPPRAGILVRDGQNVSFEPDAAAGVLLNGSLIQDPTELKTSDLLKAGRVTFNLLPSGDRIGVRLRDPESELRRRFRGLRWFPVQPAWRIAARFVRYDGPRQVNVANVAGDFETLTIPGEAVFAIAGQEVRLQAAQSGRRLWFIFSDALRGRETYPIRFLYADPPAEDGVVVLDFNRAYNPPCAYNPFTTCPVPPPQNRLKVPIDAGEKSYAGAQGTSTMNWR
jgi:uncharacterized protein (DUF1684 family)